MSRARTVAVYVSGHGFGHATRTAAVLEHWLAVDSDLSIRVATTSPRWLFPEAADRLLVRECSTDVGLVQPDCLTIDFAATLERLDELEASWDRRTAEEASRIREVGAELVIGDIPPLAFAAAERARVPSVAIGNFSWDWIYQHYVARDARFAVHAKRAAAAYRTARRLLRLPFHADFPAFREIADLPIVTRRSMVARADARRRLGLEGDRPLVLLSFGGIGFPGLQSEPLGDMKDIHFVTTDRVTHPPENVTRLESETIDYTVLLAACDAVITKPGYGIVAACLTNGIRLLCAWREDFPEAPILVQALEQHGTAAFVSAERLAQARFGHELEALLARPVAPTRLPADGAERAVEALSRELRA